MDNYPEKVLLELPNSIWKYLSIYGDFVNGTNGTDMRNRKISSDAFSNRLREARILRALNQRELAERLGVPPSSIAHFEGGRRKPSVANLVRLADALNVTTDFLLGRFRTYRSHIIYSRSAHDGGVAFGFHAFS